MTSSVWQCLRCNQLLRVVQQLQMQGTPSLKNKVRQHRKYMPNTGGWLATTFPEGTSWRMLLSSYNLGVVTLHSLQFAQVACRHILFTQPYGVAQADKASLHANVLQK